MTDVRVPSFGIKTYNGVTTTGNVIFVDSGHDHAADGNDGVNTEKPMATIDAAIARCSANNGDVIFVLPGHSETVTSAITLDVAGVRIIGIGWGRSRPTVTPSGAIDAINVTAANCVVENLRLVGASADVTAQINLAATDFTGRNLVIEQDATPLVGVTAASGSSRFAFEDCTWLGTANGPDVAIDIEASGINDWRVSNCLFNYGQNGIDLGVIRSSNVTEGWLIEKCRFIGVDTLALDYNSSAAATGDGVMTDCRIGVSAALTSIEDVIDVGGAQIIETYATDETAAGARVPITTAA